MMTTSDSRSINAVKNTLVAFVGYMLTMVTNLLFRGIFIQILDKAYLGLNGLFSNIISFLALAEMGVGAAIVFSLYKPLSEKNNDKVRMYVCFYKRMYQYIAGTVFVIGLAIIPFLDFFIKERPQIHEKLEVIYILFVVSSATSYLFSYRQTVLIADQKAYIVNIRLSISSIIRNVIQILWVMYTHNYIGTLAIQIVIIILTNIYISNIAVKRYPYLHNLKNTDKIQKAERKDLTARIGTLFLYRLGSYTINSTDNLLISRYFGVYTLANFSNYYFLLNVVNSIGNMIASALTPGVGNQAAAKDVKTVKSTFLSLQFAYTWLTAFFTACLAALLPPFIQLWAGSDFLLPNSTFALMLLNFFLTFKRRLMGTYRNALGLYLQAKSMAIMQGILNLVISLMLLKKVGPLGVILGTTISDICVSTWVDPYVLYKHYFKESMLEYWKNYFISLVVTLLLSVLMHYISKKVFVGTTLSFLLLALSCLSVPNFFLLVLFRKSVYFNDIVERGRIIVKRSIMKSSN